METVCPTWTAAMFGILAGIPIGALTVWLIT